MFWGDTRSRSHIEQVNIRTRLRTVSDKQNSTFSGNQYTSSSFLWFIQQSPELQSELRRFVIDPLELIKSRETHSYNMTFFFYPNYHGRSVLIIFRFYFMIHSHIRYEVIEFLLEVKKTVSVYCVDDNKWIIKRKKSENFLDFIDVSRVSFIMISIFILKSDPCTKRGSILFNLYFV